MTLQLERRRSSSRRRRSKTKQSDHQRPDIQGLRMVAVLTVFANHLWGWPGGGFVGVDIFFVISGFLITGNLLRTYDKTGSIAFGQFYLKRAKRIIPAATLVLILTCVAASFAFFPARAESTRIDAIWAFFFASNWRFAAEDTDYFTANGPVSPLQHYWSLSIEEQFYFVWPALIFVLGVLAVRKSTGSHRVVSAAAMAAIVVASFTWALVETTNSPTWAYFNTFARVWELGAGALLAICAAWIAPRMPTVARTPLAWMGLAIITASVFLVRETPGFPAPWAALPVIGTVIVIAAGIGREPKHIVVLTNPVSRYIGDISYSLYLWHWPLIVIMASVMDTDNAYYYVAVLCLAFGGAIASYHFFETPLRKTTWRSKRTRRRRSQQKQPRISTSMQYAIVGSLALIVVGLGAVTFKPMGDITVPPVITANTTDPAVTPTTDLQPLTAALQGQIADAVAATSWPDLDPPLESLIGSGRQAPEEVKACGLVNRPSAAQCTWGAADAPHTIVVLGDSVGMTWVEPLRQFALASNGQWKVRAEAMFGCTFVDIRIRDARDAISDACPGRKQSAIKAVNDTHPDVVVVSNTYAGLTNADTKQEITNDEWTAGLRKLIDQFRSATKNVVFLAAPPMEKDVATCYTRASVPADCLSKVGSAWRGRLNLEKGIAEAVDGEVLDSSILFCTPERLCPAFVGTTPVKLDKVHMTPEYAALISPAFAELWQSLDLTTE
ncbi:acyltransferase family protein [Gordonia sp. AC31]|uniref:acyltransferase family protein n=1 Tax=Gordonia sp. AC31 TaxID=2962571 RepID=UPI002881B8F6|nr:acyltransferase family protein [Gordonia sp. AC31]MDT0223435.1 acyltransferase family protein [Gordonia sp. AC31]